MRVIGIDENMVRDREGWRKNTSSRPLLHVMEVNIKKKTLYIVHII